MESSSCYLQIEILSFKMRFLCLHGSGANSQVRCCRVLIVVIVKLSHASIIFHLFGGTRLISLHRYTKSKLVRYAARDCGSVHIIFTQHPTILSEANHLPYTAALRYELGDHHSFEFVEGSVACPMASGSETPLSGPRLLLTIHRIQKRWRYAR